MAALAGEGQQPRLGEFGQMAARRLRGDAGAIGKLACGQRLTAHQSRHHIGPGAIAHQRPDLGKRVG